MKNKLTLIGIVIAVMILANAMGVMADIQLTATVSPTFVTSGTTNTFTFTLNNDGSNNIRRIEISATGFDTITSVTCPSGTFWTSSSSTSTKAICIWTDSGSNPSAQSPMSFSTHAPDVSSLTNVQWTVYTSGLSGSTDTANPITQVIPSSWVCVSKNASTFASVSIPSISDNDWDNEGNAQTSNNLNANVNLGRNQQSEYLKATGFGFTIPIGSTIEGIIVHLEKAAEDTNDISDYSLQLVKNNVVVGSNRADTTTKWGTSDQVFTYGSFDKWGETWVPSDVNNVNFGTAFSAQHDSSYSNDNAYVDYLNMTVCYTPDTTPPSGGSITYTNGYFTALSVPITYTLGTDSGAGLNAASGVIQRATATLIEGTCGTFGSFTNLTVESDGSYTDASVVSGNCYMYRYSIADNVGNRAYYTSTNVAKISICGNSVINGNEQCDDGNTANGDCCSSTCQYETAGSSCGSSSDTACDNPNTCNGAGICLSNYEITGTDCGICAACNGAGTCSYDSTQNADCSATTCPADGCGAGGCGTHIFGDFPVNVANTCSAIYTCTSNVCSASCEADEGDGYSYSCGDCNAGDVTIYPGATEACNGVNDDCDAGTADGVGEAWLGSACDGTDSDLCNEGTYSCTAGSQLCSDNTDSLLDICDGTDNDCDAASADGSEDPQLGVACDGADADLCHEGVKVCAAGALMCNDPNDADPELCNNADDDCNPATADGSNEAWINEPTTCGTGVCASIGAFVCTAGVKTDTCSAGAPTGDDSNCNGVDEDCSGTADNNYVPISSCFLPGVCAASNAASTCIGGIETACTTGTPGIEICSNGLDDNCDGSIDEYPNSAPVADANGPYKVAVGKNMQLDGTGSSDPDSGCGDSVAVWEWDLDNDGTYDDASGSNPQLTWTDVQLKVCGGACNAGQVHQIKLRVTDTNLASSTDVSTITVIACDNGDTRLCPLQQGVCAGSSETCTGEQWPGCNYGADYEATETSCDGLDNDCNGAVDEDFSYMNWNMQQLFGVGQACGTGVCAGGMTVCNMAKTGITCSTAGLAMTEGTRNCDGLDNDCDGTTDDWWTFNHPATSCGVGACASTGTESCVAGQIIDSCTPGLSGTEICNGIDDDCDGVLDGSESLSQQCGSTDVGECAFGTETCTDAGAWAGCTAIIPVTETCDGLDNDCDSANDNGFPDTDGDGLANCIDSDDDNDGVIDINDVAPLNPQICTDFDGDTCDDCSQNPTSTSSSKPWVLYTPSASNDGTDTDGDGMCDVGDGDDDNDGLADGPDDYNEDPRRCTDSDLDGCNDCSQNPTSSSTIIPPPWPAYTPNPLDDGPDVDSDGICDLTDTCTDVDKDTYCAETNDCDDGNKLIYLGAPETPGNGVDEDCNGVDARNCFVDSDEDGYGSMTITVALDGTCDTSQSESSNSNDCNDADAGTSPVGTEIPGNNKDEDCSGSVDCYNDNDNDGYGTTTIAYNAYTATGGIANTLCSVNTADTYDDTSDDCDDNDNVRFPGNPEACDRKDNNCNFVVDELDQVAPTTTDNAPAGWQSHNVDVTLSATDTGVCGVQATYYCVDQADTCSPSILYSAPVSISADGTNHIRYLSIDNSGFGLGYSPLTYGNVETVKSATVLLDKTFPTVHVEGAMDTYNGGTSEMGTDSGAFVLVTHNYPETAKSHMISFESGSTASEELMGLTALYIDTTGLNVAGLTAYYNARGLPTEYLDYLLGALDGSTHPFAYITTDASNNLVLHDAAQYDIAGNHDVGMVIPDDYPLGTYTVKGTGVDKAGNTVEITLKLKVTGDRDDPVITIVSPDTTPAKTKTITASADKGIFEMSITDGTVACDSSLTFVAYDSITFTSESDNGKKVCYHATMLPGDNLEAYSLSAAIAGIDTTAPSLTITGATADGNDMPGSLGAGYTLWTTNNAGLDRLIQFKTGTVADETLEDTYFGLKLISSTVSADDLKAYYLARGVPTPFIEYLNDAAEGDNPFVYIKGSTVKLVDAAKHDLIATDVDMTVPDNYPRGTYTVSGIIKDLAGNEKTVTLILKVDGDREAPSLTITGATADGNDMPGSLEAGYTLWTTNNAGLDRLIQFKTGTVADETLEDTYFGLKLISSTVSPADLKAYYLARGVPTPFIEYLNDAADSIKPFVYIKGSTVRLVDAAKHDLIATDVDMTVPDNYPLGTYTVEGKIKDLAGNEKTVTLILIVAGDREAPTLAATFEADGVPMTEDPAGTFELLTHNVAATTHMVQFDSGVASEDLSSDMFALKLISNTANPTELAAYYNSKPTPYKEYLNGALAGTNAFAYIYQDTSKDDIKLADGAAYNIEAGNKVSMRIPDNYPLGTYTVQGIIKDLAGNEQTVTYTLSVTGDRVSPVLTVAGFTDNGVHMAESPAGTYTLLTHNVAANNHEIKFEEVSTSDELLKDEAFGLYLDTAGVDITGLTAYYNARIPDGSPAQALAYRDYLISALDGVTKPFAYITGDSSKNLILHDAAQYDLVPNPTVGMIIPDNYPLGTYKVHGIVKDVEGNPTPVTYTLIVSGDRIAPVIDSVSPIIMEATSSAGALVTITPPMSHDLVDGDLVSLCDYATGTFPIAVTTVTCSKTDAAGNVATPITFTVTVQDTTAPELTVSGNLELEANKPEGRDWPYAAPIATDAVGVTELGCDIPSPSTFPLGITTVTCHAKDAAGHNTIKTFTVTVKDTTAPTLNLPADIVVNTDIHMSTAFVTYTASATDLVLGTIPYFPGMCNPPSPANYPVGVTTVNCAVTDNYGNTGTGSFTVTVNDNEAPRFLVPHEDMTEEATSPAGAVVTYTKPTATDNVDGAIISDCTPASGSTFALGDTDVTCTATDSHGNAATPDVFKVTVKDTINPTSTIDAPAPGPLKGTVTLTATATDSGSGVDKVEFWYASHVGNKIGEVTYPGPYSIDWNTRSVPNGIHHIWTEVYDKVGNHYTSSEVEVEVDNCGDGIVDTGEQCDDHNTANGDCCSSTCQYESTGSACGDSSTSECDNANTCNGAGVCLENHVADGNFCGDAGSECVVQDTCLAGACHDNKFVPTGTACGSPANTECTDPDTCDGAGICLANNEPSTTTCGDGEGQCINQDFCDGSGACYDNGFKDATTTCSGTHNGDLCDATDKCSGTSNTCVDNYQPNTYTCRPTAGTCDVVEKCTGSSSACPADGFFPSTTVCHAATGDCDVAETCTGTSADCPVDAVRPYGDVCAVETGQCEANDICDGSTKTCNEKYALPGTTCDDGQYCTVNEVCDGANTCGSGAARDCSGNNRPEIATCFNDPDNNDYTWDLRAPFTSSCDEGANVCTSAGEISHNANDEDLDGYSSLCGDCNDDPATGALIHPGATEICNNVDDDCDSKIDEDFTDLGQSCSLGLGNCLDWGLKICSADHLSTVCDATPGTPMPETCDSLDEDCDGAVDEDLTRTTSNQNGMCAGNSETCYDGHWGWDAGNYAPTADDVNCNGLDEDCSGTADEDYVPVTSCFLPGACSASNTASSCTLGTETACSTGTPAANDETCDGIDDDCSGTPDEDYVPAPTACGKGICAAAGELACVSGSIQDTCTAGTPGTEACDGLFLDENCDGNANEGCNCVDGTHQICGSDIGECQAGLSTCEGGQWGLCVGEIGPATETCNWADDDCDGIVDNADDNLLKMFFADVDGDGFGDHDDPYPELVCFAPAGYVADSTDCNDNPATGASIHPGATEVCNGIDDNCDSQIDETCTCVHGATRPCGVDTPPCSAGMQTCEFGIWGLCLGGTQPTDETCNGIDDDCDTEIDESPLFDAPINSGCWNLPGNCCLNNGLYYCPPPGASCHDLGSLQGVCQIGSMVCSNGGWVCQNDVAPTIETCNGLDDNCDGTVDEGVKSTFYADADSDGFGNVLVTQLACTAPAGFITDSTDCDDSRALTNPDADEMCNGVDDNCDGTVDNGFNVGEACDSASNNCNDFNSGYYKCTGDGLGTVCDAITPTDVPGIGESCTSESNNCGLTAEGINVCSLDKLSAECNAITPDDPEHYGEACESEANACGTKASGTIGCDGLCNAVMPATPTEICNALDDDCDGTTDEGCTGEGSCPAGTTKSFVETVNVLADGLIYSSANSLALGKQYVIDASGTYTFSPGWQPDAGIADAAYSLRPEGSYNAGPGAQWVDGAVFPAPWVNWLELWINNAAVNWGTFNAGHEYSTSFTGAGVPVSFNIYDDAYGDNSGSLDVNIYSCEPIVDVDGDGYTVAAGDCNDDDATVYPGAADAVCNGIDNDCDGTADEDFTPQATSCGIGVCAAAGTTSCISGEEQDSCIALEPTLTLDTTCNGLDEDCSGEADEDYEPYATSCGVGACLAAGTTSCISGEEQDSCIAGTPGTEVCEGSIDEDCDGTVDEDCAVEVLCPAGTTKTFVETVNVPAADVLGASGVALDNGITYLLEASGTWQNSNNAADAEFISADNWATHANGYDIDPYFLGEGSFDLQVNDAFVNWGAYNAGHAYALSTVGDGSAVKFRIFDGDSNTGIPTDSWYSDNSGSLAVNIYKCVPPVVECTVDADCSNGLVCDGTETCNAENKCVAGTPVDCSANDITAIASCTDVDHESNPYTWDFREVFTSACEEPTGICTTGNETVSHTCDVAECSAICDATNACADTACGTDGCVGKDYYDYTDVANTCLEGCTCETNDCAAPIIITNDARCIADCHGADLNGDSKVDVQDLIILTDNFGRTDCVANSYCNNADINKDGTVDGADLVLFTPNFGKTECALTACVPATEICDSIDNDCDSLVDEGDVCVVPVEICDDTLDNDGDTFVDCTDPDCTSNPICAPSPFCGDATCNGEETCLTCEDDCGTCPPLSETQCSDTIDNDGDGDVDCADSDCVNDPVCIENICGNGEIGSLEGCDDANLVGGDGCSEICTVEPGYLCLGEPSICSLECVPSAEVCDGVDNDCDAEIDEGDVCGPICIPSAEDCNGLDDDCNDLVDDGLTPPSQSCSVGVGECARTGTQTKTCNGVLGWSAWGTCSATPGTPVKEVCGDGKDNDCDGKVDEYCTAKAKLTVIKRVINDDGRTKKVSDFALFVNTKRVYNGTQNTFDSGYYKVWETNDWGYSATYSGDCSANGIIRLRPGDVKTCIITNNDKRR